MMDTSKIESILPGSELGEIRPCTAPGKLQFHLLVGDRKDPTDKVINIPILAAFLEDHPPFSDVKSSLELGVVKAKYRGAELSILASGRVVVKKTAGEKEAQDILESLAPLLKKSLF